MHFCNICDNMYYIRIAENDENSLIYYCRNCGNEDNTLINNGLCGLKTQIKREEKKYLHIINKYTKLDPTLPRINNVKCPNQDCPTNSSTDENKIENEVIYIRYDDINMKYIYLCAICDTSWKTTI